MRGESIYIRKAVGKKKLAFIIDGQDSEIPEFLQDSVRITRDGVKLNCLEYQNCEELYWEDMPNFGGDGWDYGWVIAYEQLDNGDYNCWVKSNAPDTLAYDGYDFTELPAVNQAALITRTLPDFADGANAWVEDGFGYVMTSWSPDPASGPVGEAYWVRYNPFDYNADPDMNILAVQTPSFRDYIVCDEDGNEIETLEDYHYEQ